MRRTRRARRAIGGAASMLGVLLLTSGALTSIGGCDPTSPGRRGYRPGLLGSLASESTVLPSASAPPPENSNDPPHPLAERHPCHIDEPLPAEPERPVSECNPRPESRCVAATPARTEWQHPPFASCPREIPDWGDAIVVAPPRFSAKETRAHRLDGKCAVTPEEGDCCYVEYTALACD